MRSFTKESLELLRQRIDLHEVISPYVRLTKSGASYKGLCPFHDEKTSSFIMQQGDSHYHCYGCGAHGDAIAFLMNYQKLTFYEAVENLAEKFQVRLEFTEEKHNDTGPSRSSLKDVLEKASNFYHFLLLHSKEAQGALQYLYNRGIDLDFIKTFQIGYSSSDPFLFQKYMQENSVDNELLLKTGLLRINNHNQIRDFFSDRIMIPIQDALGSVIGFSSRKFKEETFGGKYINTQETPLFKKSKILFGLNYCRKKIAKERKAIIVEGQIDALRLIYAGFSIVVASQGTAFTEDHVKELTNLGVNHIYLAFDADDAGQEAALKTGHLFQKIAVDVSVVQLPDNSDPDTILIEQGPEVWTKLLEESVDYLTFLVKFFSQKIDVNTPSGKNELVRTIVKRIKEWEQPLMVHESLRKLAKLTKTPESIIGADQELPANIHIKREGNLSFAKIDADKILETDLLRLIFLMGESNTKLVEIAQANLKPENFKISTCRILFEKYIKAFLENKPRDLLSLAIDIEESEDQCFLSEILDKKINKERVEESFLKAVQEILDRNWMEEREKIRQQIQSGNCTDEEVLELAKQFDEIKKLRPQVILSKN